MRTERLTLRRPAMTDLQTVHQIHADPATNAYNPAGPHTTPEQSRELLAGWLADWARDGFGYWAVARHDGTVIGFGGLRRTTIDGEPVLNLYYRFSPAAWGHGYAGEMVQAALDLAARLDGGEPVVAVIRDTNTPSQRVAERAGLVCAGTIDHRGAPSRLYRLPVGARS